MAKNVEQPTPSEGSNPDNSITLDQIITIKQGTEPNNLRDLRINGKSWEEMVSDHRWKYVCLVNSHQISSTDKFPASYFYCQICQDLLKNPKTIKPCLHKCCSDCISQYIRKYRKECPFCRDEVLSKRTLREDPRFVKILSCFIKEEKEFSLAKDQAEQALVQQSIKNFQALEKIRRDKERLNLKRQEFDRPLIKLEPDHREEIKEGDLNSGYSSVSPHRPMGNRNTQATSLRQIEKLPIRDFSNYRRDVELGRMRPDQKIIEKVNQSRIKAFKRSNIMQVPKSAGISNRILTVHIFYIANYQQKTVPELSFKVSESCPMNTVKMYLAKNLWGNQQRYQEITLYVRIYGMDMAELQPEESLAATMEKYSSMSNWVSREESVMSVYYSVADPFFFML